MSLPTASAPILASAAVTGTDEAAFARAAASFAEISGGVENRFPGHREVGTLAVVRYDDQFEVTEGQSFLGPGREIRHGIIGSVGVWGISNLGKLAAQGVVRGQPGDLVEALGDVSQAMVGRGFPKPVRCRLCEIAEARLAGFERPFTRNDL